MPIFMCSKCKSIENTAVCDYWGDVYRKDPLPALCSECKTGKWHGVFEKKSSAGYAIGEDRFLYKHLPHHTTLVSIIQEDGSVKEMSQGAISQYFDSIKPTEEDIAKMVKDVQSLQSTINDHPEDNVQEEQND